MRPTGAENDGGLRRPVRETDFVDVVAGRATLLERTEHLHSAPS